MMLDTKRTFDRMVETYAPDERVRETIFANSYYQQLSTTLGGSRELIAMERVLEIHNAAEHDLLIVDTPPAQHALDFLDAPKRLIDLLDGSFHPGAAGTLRHRGESAVQLLPAVVGADAEVPGTAERAGDAGRSVQLSAGLLQHVRRAEGTLTAGPGADVGARHPLSAGLRAGAGQPQSGGPVSPNGWTKTASASPACW